MNIVQAIGIANDLTLAGNRKKVILIREENNLRKQIESTRNKEEYKCQFRKQIIHIMKLKY